MKVIQKGYTKRGFEILLIPETEDERDGFMQKSLYITYENSNKQFGVMKITIEPEV